jgi:hypothetical protein
MDQLEGNTRFLATLLIETTSMWKWTYGFFLQTDAEVADGKISTAEQLKLFQDHILVAKPSGFLGPINLDSVDWKALFDYCKSKLNISDQAVGWQRSLAQGTHEQLREGYQPRLLRDVLSADELNKYVQELAEQELDRTFRVHRIDYLLAFVDWLERNQGPFDAIELPNVLRRLLRAKSGTCLARIWLQTLPLRYPRGVPWITSPGKE